MRRFTAWLAILMVLQSLPVHAKCVGKFPNPITDIHWKCFFPLRIAGMTVVGGQDDTPSPGQLICWCRRPPIPGKLPGIPISFWEPVRLIDITRTPLCFVNMGGLCLGDEASVGMGAVEENNDTTLKKSFYHGHWYIFPIFYMFERIIDFVCLEKGSFDLAYMTEFDPFWSDEEKSAILNPEAIVFGNSIAEGACIGDCLKASTGLPFDELFWCGGCQGSLYPFTGTVGDHLGGVQASLLLAQRLAAKLHRELLLWGTYGVDGLCGKYPMPIIKKTQYRLQMTYPGNPGRCDPFGRSSVLWEWGKESPYQGEDFGYLLWRKRDCCLL